MDETILLEVPYSEKDNAKSLGAKWNPKIKKWYVPKNESKEKFDQWIPDTSSTPTLTAKAPIYLLKSWERCYSCGEIADVFCLASMGVMDDDTNLDMFLHFFNLSYIPKNVEEILKTTTSSYYMDFTKMSNSYYYVNHCNKCNAKFGDFYLHNEPEGAFFPICEEQAQDITMYKLDAVGDINIDSGYGMQDIDFISKHAKRQKL